MREPLDRSGVLGREEGVTGEERQRERLRRCGARVAGLVATRAVAAGGEEREDECERRRPHRYQTGPLSPNLFLVSRSIPVGSVLMT